MDAISVNGPPLRWSTVRQRASASVANASSGSEATTIHLPLLQLGLELTRAPARLSGEHAGASQRQLVGAAIGGREGDATTITRLALGLELVELDQDDDRLRLDGPGPRRRTPSTQGSSDSSGTATAISSSEGRERTSPTAPSSSWWVTSTTVRRKLGSTSDGEETRQPTGQRVHPAAHRSQLPARAQTPARARPTAASWTRESRSPRKTCARTTVTTG